ncbi:SRPBCC domain-containing protein [Mycolicibacterium smegmatis]|uniref:SRPBCC family protein n=1 Tax=Mycolicibacterium smegmatis TaxID=1772 RepID=UPI001E36E26D|nr:SRPBCC family protein [Mycolicibacterium smegmatis]UGU32519.1 SRPBCC domain-containing protein [Mycolicibacterium smegmatis]ULN67411.1 SRPBCC domain-containing protein [Mycolicibacterium smegmatis]
MTDIIEARVEHRFESATAEQVFDAWLDQGDVRAWMAAALRAHGLEGDIRRVEIDPRVGGRFFFSDVRDGAEAEHWGTYQALERPKLIEFTWFTSEDEEQNSTSLVRIEITPEPQGCSVVLTHKLDATFAEYREPTETGWRTMLTAVDQTSVSSR